MTTQPQTLYLVDGTSQLFRAYFAIRGLSNADGMPTNAVYGFANMLRKLIQDEKPRYLGVAFDRSEETFRHERFADYKANRPDIPEDFRVQAPYARKVCEVLRIPVLELQNFEADDLIATLARQAREAGFEVVVVASDKDLLQLVGDGVTVLNPTREVRLDAAGVRRDFGVPPELVCDVQGLMGDAVDNIPGVPGIGEKTAKSLVTSYGGLEAILEQAARFVAAFDARDSVLEALATPDDTSSIERALAALVDALERLAEGEADGELRERWREVLDTLRAGPGRKLRGVLKGMDRKSGRRTWYAVHEHAERARLSRELATLCAEAPVAFDPDSLRLGAPDTGKARALFRSLGFRGLTEDFLGVVEATQSAPRGPAEGAARHEILTDDGALRRFAEDCRAAGRLSLVVEDEGGHPLDAKLVGLGLSHTEGHGAYVPLNHDYLGAPRQLAPGTAFEVLGPLFEDSSLVKHGEDLKRAAHVLRSQGVALAGHGLDTTVGAFLLNSSRASYHRETLAGELLGVELTGREALTGSGARRRRLAEVEIERVGEYAAAGAEATLRLAVEIERRLEQAGLESLYREIDGPLLPLLERMEARGIRVDTDLLGRMSREMEAALDTARSEIHALAGEEFNVDSPKQLREVLFERLGLKPRRKTAKSKVASTDAQTLEELAEEHDIARKLLEYRELSKLKGTYVDTLPSLVRAQTGRVHTSFHPTGAATGRLSSSDPNLQNIPARSEAGRRIRAAFVPDPGNRFLAADYSQIELRVLAHLCRDGELIRAFREGQDIHRHTAARVFGVAPDLVTDEMRRRAKAVNFGILYGMSELRLAREQGIPRAEARRFIQAYFERFGAVREYIDRVRDEVRRDGAVRTLFGRIRYFPQLHQRVNRAVQEQALRAAVNTTIQGTAADLMKLAMLRVEGALAREGLANKILLQVHDELLLEVAEGEVDRVGPLLVETMQAVHPMEVPLVVDLKVGRSWAEVT